MMHRERGKREKERMVDGGKCCKLHCVDRRREAWRPFIAKLVSFLIRQAKDQPLLGLILE